MEYRWSIDGVSTEEERRQSPFTPNILMSRIFINSFLFLAQLRGIDAFFRIGSTGAVLANLYASIWKLSMVRYKYREALE